MNTLRDEALKDPKLAKAIAFLMYHLDDMDDAKALFLVESIDLILRGESLSEGIFPTGRIDHLAFEFSDHVARLYDPIEGFVEI